MNFMELREDELTVVDGGVAVSAVCAIASGVCYIGAGVAAWTGHSKVAAGLTVAGGVCDIAAGVAMILP